MLSKDFNDECAVFGIWGDPEASHMTYLGLYALQHRGQESSGIVTLQNHEHTERKGRGLVGDVFSEDDLNDLKGAAAIGHCRYSTTGKALLSNIHPLTARLLSGPLALAHNGNLVNNLSLRQFLKKKGAIFQGSSDTENILHLLAQDPDTNLASCLKRAFLKIQGAYSLVILSHEQLIVARDPHGIRPLVLGKRHWGKNGEFSWVVASETCAFDLIGAEYEREVLPGEMIVIDEKGLKSEIFVDELPEKKQCVFEHVYFSRPDSKVFGLSVYESRKLMGAALAQECPAEADLVIPVPDSGIPSSLGYSKASGIPFELGIIRNHYIGRTFIQPTQSIRSFGVKIKLNPQKEVLGGKRLVVVDDSLVRGTTSKKIIALLRQAGAKEVHFRVACPPTTGPCYYGVDTPVKEDLIASQKTHDEICKYIGADSLGYLSEKALLNAVKPAGTFCAACFNGEYIAFSEMA